MNIKNIPYSIFGMKINTVLAIGYVFPIFFYYVPYWDSVEMTGAMTATRYIVSIIIPILIAWPILGWLNNKRGVMKSPVTYWLLMIGNVLWTIRFGWIIYDTLFPYQPNANDFASVEAIMNNSNLTIEYIKYALSMGKTLLFIGLIVLLVKNIKHFMKTKAIS